MTRSTSAVPSSPIRPSIDSAELIKATKLHRWFGSRRGRRGGRLVRAVDGVDIAVFRGETLGIVGETGSGKSTLGRLLIGLLSPSSGTVQFEGVDLSSLSKGQLRQSRRGMQMIFQDPLGSLDPRWSVRRILAEPLKAHGARQSAALGQRIEELIQTVGLDPTIINRLPTDMSGGQRQRVGIARALALDPRVIIADEPVSALDVSVQAQIINLLMDLQQEFNLSFVFIAHGLEVVRHISDRVAVMYLGRMVELATTDQLFQHPGHPYTDSLLGSVPRPDPNTRRELRVVSGEIGSGRHLPTGCRFHPRCPARVARCELEDPELHEIRPGHFVACHFPLKAESLWTISSKAPDAVDPSQSPLGVKTTSEVT
ncbi:MAG: ABC transporter ATP-binding protein [Ferrimicrobium sp.]